MLPAAPGAVVLATYPNRDIAAATYRYGKGRVEPSARIPKPTKAGIARTA